MHLCLLHVSLVLVLNEPLDPFFRFWWLLNKLMKQNNQRQIFMAALQNRAGHFRPVVSYLSSSLWPPCVADVDSTFLSSGFFFYLFFLAYSQPPYVGCLPYFRT